MCSEAALKRSSLQLVRLSEVPKEITGHVSSFCLFVHGDTNGGVSYWTG